MGIVGRTLSAYRISLQTHAIGASGHGFDRMCDESNFQDVHFTLRPWARRNRCPKVRAGFAHTCRQRGAARVVGDKRMIESARAIRANPGGSTSPLPMRRSMQHSTPGRPLNAAGQAGL